GVELVGGDRLPVLGVADHDPAQSPAQVAQRGGQRQRRHHLRGRGDVEPGLAGHAVGPATEAGDDVAQRTVVDVEHPTPGDAVGLDAQGVAAVEVVVEHRAEQVVGGGDGVHVAGQVQVEALHGNHLAVAAAGG